MRMLFILLTIIFLSSNLFSNSIEELNKLKIAVNTLINTSPPTEDEKVDEFKKKINDNISIMLGLLSKIIDAKEKVSNLDDLIRKINESEKKIGKEKLKLIYYKKKLLKLQDVKVLTDAWKQYTQNKTWENFRNLYKLTKGIELPEDYSRANPGLKDYDLIAQIIYFQDIRPKRVVEVCEALVKIATKLVELPELIASTITDPVGTALDTAKEMLTDTILEESGVADIFGVSTIVKTITGDGGIGGAIGEVQGIAENMAQESLENAKQTLYGLKEMDEEDQKNVSLEDLRKKISDTIDKTEKIIEEEDKTLSSYKEKKKNLEKIIADINSYISEIQDIIKQLYLKLAYVNNSIEEKDKLLEKEFLENNKKVLKEYCMSLGSRVQNTKLAIDKITSFFTGYPIQTFLEIFEEKNGYIEYEDSIDIKVEDLLCGSYSGGWWLKESKHTRKTVKKHKIRPLEKIKHVVKIIPDSLGKVSENKLKFISDLPQIDNTSIGSYKYKYTYCQERDSADMECKYDGNGQCSDFVRYWNDILINSTKECSTIFNKEDIVVYGIEKIGLNLEILNKQYEKVISKDSNAVEGGNLILYVPFYFDSTEIKFKCFSFINSGKKIEKRSFTCSKYMSIFIDGKKEKIDAIKLVPQKKPIQIDIKVPEKLNFSSYFSYKIYPIRAEFEVDYPVVYDIVEKPEGSGQLIHYIPLGESFIFSVNINSEANINAEGFFVEFHIKDSVYRDKNGDSYSNEIIKKVEFKNNRAILNWKVSDVSERFLEITMIIKDKNNNLVDSSKKEFNIQPIKIVKNIEFVNDNISLLSTDFFYPYGKYDKFHRIEQPYKLKLTYIDNSEDIFSLHYLISATENKRYNGKNISQWLPYNIEYFVSSKANISMKEDEIRWDQALKRAAERKDNTLIFTNDKYPVNTEWSVAYIGLFPKSDIILIDHSDNLTKKYDLLKSVSDTIMLSTNIVKLYTKDNKKYLMVVVKGPANLKNYKVKWIFYNKTILTKLTKANNGDYFSTVELKDLSFYSFKNLQILDFLGHVKAEISDFIVHNDPDFQIVEYDKQYKSVSEVNSVKFYKNEIPEKIKKIIYQVCYDKLCHYLITGSEFSFDNNSEEDEIELFSKDNGISCGIIYFWRYMIQYDNNSWSNWSDTKPFKLAGTCSFECNKDSLQNCYNESDCLQAGGNWNNYQCEKEGIEGIIKLLKGWNLKALPVHINNGVILDKFNINGINSVWEWRNSKWIAWSGVNQLISLMKKYNIEIIESIKSAEGFWINAIEDVNINIGKGSKYGIDKINLVSGWNLVGCGEKLNAEQFDNINTLWQWTGKNWKIWSPNSELIKLLKKYNVEIVNEIESGEGFWINK